MDGRGSKPQVEKVKKLAGGKRTGMPMYTIRLSRRSEGRSGGGVLGLCSLYDALGVALAGEEELNTVSASSERGKLVAC
jgi:hypothetical protein